MRRSMIPLRLSQPTLFHPIPSSPSFQTLPPDIQAHTIRLLARLLRQHLDHVMTLGVMREMGDE